MENPAEVPVLISALQHYLFCPKQFAIIHLEQHWKENYLTADGRRLHERVDLPGNHRSRGARVEYALPLISEQYALSGKADAVEFLADGSVIPIEYKRGHAKADYSDMVQLCAQALCLEEMMKIRIPEGALFYFEKREKVTVLLDDALRRETIEVINACRALLAGEKILPPAVRSAHCRGCSLLEYCMPQNKPHSASEFLKREICECVNC